MKRGISLALQAAGMLLVCMAASLNHPVFAHTIVMPLYDTVRYYNEHGVEIFCDAHALKQGNYVIRTCKKKDSIFYDWPRIQAAIDSGKYKPARVRAISRERAEKVEALIAKGLVNKTIVKKSIVEIMDRAFIRKLFDLIQDSGEGKDTLNDFGECGGVVYKNGSLTCGVGEKSDPRTQGSGIWVPNDGIAVYHSHPSGEKSNGFYYFIQGPSRVDQKYICKRTGYVFGMNKRSHLIYIYKRKGVLATLPFCFLLSK